MTKQEFLQKLQHKSDSTVDEYVNDLKEKFGKYAASIEETRAAIDSCMGDKLLTDVLNEMREEPQ